MGNQPVRTLLASIEQFRKDVHFGLRSFLRTPALSCLALLSLALGIGATTAIFSAVYSVIVDPFPYGDARHLMSVSIDQPGDGQNRIGFTPEEFLDLNKDATVFSSLTGSVWSYVALTGHGEPQRLDGAYSSPNIFQTLQVKPLLGRNFVESDADPGAPAVVVLSYKCWQRVFAGDAGVLGREVRINDELRTIIAVMPERVYWLEADVYLPVTFHPGQATASGNAILIISRLKPGVTLPQAEANLQSVFSEMARREPKQFPPHWHAALKPFPDVFPTRIRNELLMLLAAVGLLLLIACANVSSLLVSKASARQKEMAIRSSLGASRGRIVRQLLTESLLLACGGCLAGLFFASLGLRLILSMVPSETIPIEAKISLNLPVLLFSLAVSLAVAFLAGLAPAFHATREELALSLRETGRGAGASRTQTAFREGLVVLEVALSLVLLVAGSLMLRTLFALQHVPLGLSVDKVLTLRIPLPPKRYNDAAGRALALEHILTAIRQTPGVVAASLNVRPHPLDNIHASVEVAGYTGLDSKDVMVHQTDQHYFPVLGIPLVSGRAWSEAEVRGQRRLAIVNQTFVRRYLAGRPALGVAVQLPTLGAPIGDHPFAIIGIVADVLNQGLAKRPAPEIYLPYTLAGTSQDLVVRTAAQPMSMARAVTAAIRRVDSQLPVTDVMSMESAINRYLLTLSRFQMTLFSLFASTGLLLAIAGIYGVVSNSVERRTPELGLRLALGARSGQIISLVLGSGMRLVLVGIALGLASARLVTRFMASFLFGVIPADPVSFSAVALMISAVGLVACLWPACRAARIDAVRSLRQE